MRDLSKNIPNSYDDSILLSNVKIVSQRLCCSFCSNKIEKYFKGIFHFIRERTLNMIEMDGHEFQCLALSLPSNLPVHMSEKKVDGFELLFLILRPFHAAKPKKHDKIRPIPTQEG